jgi:hypothetical protein
MVLGRSSAEDQDSSAQAREACQKVNEGFKKRNRSTCCRVLTKDIYGTVEQKKQCKKFTGEVAYMTAQILAEAQHIPLEE